MVTRAALLELAAQSEAAGNPTFAHVHEIEESRAAVLEAQFKSEWSATLERRRSWP